ncbi:hypothetical protein D3C87_868860 [compost metagenome]
MEESIITKMQLYHNSRMKVLDNFNNLGQIDRMKQYSKELLEVLGNNPEQIVHNMKITLHLIPLTNEIDSLNRLDSILSLYEEYLDSLIIKYPHYSNLLKETKDILYSEHMLVYDKLLNLNDIDDTFIESFQQGTAKKGTEPYIQVLGTNVRMDYPNTKYDIPTWTTKTSIIDYSKPIAPIPYNSNGALAEYARDGTYKRNVGENYVYQGNDWYNTIYDTNR